MQETQISQRHTIQLPGLTFDRHVSVPDELEFSGYSDRRDLKGISS
jgi:AraC family transcriptional regulator